MAKRQTSVSLSFVLARFSIVMLGSMLLCGMAWLFVLGRLQSAGIIYHGSVSNQQVEKLLSGEPKAFTAPGNDFLAEYALFGMDGEVLESNVNGNKLTNLTAFLREDTRDIHISRHTYGDGSTVIIQWRYRREFVSPQLRGMLPPFEYLWAAALGVAWMLCLVFSTLWLRGCLAAKLELFGEVSKKISAQKLDFTIPHAGIREYDQALEAMEQMRKTLYLSLSSQWAAQQEREAEIAALAHDLKTPLTLVGGNAELLLEETLSDSSRKLLETIVASNNRTKQYVAALLEASAGTDEGFESTGLPAMFDELYQNTIAVAEAKGVFLLYKNDLRDNFCMQKNHLLRALGNVVQNAIEHTPEGGNVYLEGSMTANGGWKVVVRDEGPGFSKAALHHATERLWRTDPARSADGHHGLGLWFAAQVVAIHKGRLKLQNQTSGAVVVISFR